MLDITVDGPFPFRREPLWLPAGLLAAVLLLTMTAGAFGGQGQMKWRPAGVKAKPAPTVAQSKPAKQQGRVSRARWIDPNVRSVAYDEPGLRVAQDNGDFADELLKEFSKPMGEKSEGEPSDLFGDLPEPPKPNSDEPPAIEPPVIEPPVIESTEDTSPAQPEFDPPSFDKPKFDPFDEREEPKLESLDPPPVPSAPRRPRLDSRPRPIDKPMTAEEKRRAKERAEATKDCAEELAKLRSSNLSLVDITISRTGVEGEDYPYVCTIDDGIPLAPRSWAPITYTWKASALCHKPLYFEQEQLERYGHSWGPMLQPIISGAHFFGRLPALPYMMGLRAPNECVYALGHYRPGNCAPYLIPALPITKRAILFQGGITTGAAFLIP